MNIKQNKNRGIRALGLKKSTAEDIYYNPNMFGLEFKKTKNGIEMIVPEWFKKEHRQKLSSLHYYSKKYGLSNKADIKKEKDLYKYYTDYVKKWNKGEISKISTVKYRFDLYNENQKLTNKFYSRENKQKIIKYADDSFKVKVMRMQGKHGVYNEKAYNDYINDLAKLLSEDKEEIERLIFPSGINEESSYETIHNLIDKGIDSIDRLIDIKVAFEDLDEVEEFVIRRKLL